MKRLLLLPPLLLGLAVYSCLPARHSWHQKLTLVVDTPQGEVSGSAVVEVRVGFYEGGQFMSGTEVVYDLTGEAVAVEVLPGRYLFALLGNSEELFFYAAKDRFKGLTRGEWLRLIPDQTEPVTLTGDLLPMLVTFADIEDPKTVQLVDPTDLAASFGPGVELNTVTLEVTDEPVTKGRVEAVFDYFSWDTERRKAYTCSAYGCGINPIRYSLPDGTENALSELDFISGVRE